MAHTGVEQILDPLGVHFPQGALRWGRPSLVDRLDDGRKQRKNLNTKLSCVPIKALGQATGLTDDVRQTAQTSIVAPIDAVSIAHQPILEGLTKDLRHDGSRARPDNELRWR